MSVKINPNLSIRNKMASTLHLLSLVKLLYWFCVTVGDEDVEGPWLGVTCGELSAVVGVPRGVTSAFQPYLCPLLSKNSRLSNSSPKHCANHKAFWALVPNACSRLLLPLG